MVLLMYVLGGAVAGVLAGLFGIGGGLLLVPLLLASFVWQEIGFNVAMSLAVATSLAAIVPTGAMSAWSHHRRDGVDWRIWRLLLPGLMIGAGGGAVLATALSGRTLQVLYGGFVWMVAVHLLRSDVTVNHTRARPWEWCVVGVPIGMLSALVGIGGGTLTVPYLAWRGVPLVRAVGTSAAAGVPIAFAAVLGYVVTGLGRAPALPLTTGYVVWPAVFALAAGSMLCAPLGVRLAHRWPVRRLRQGFAVYLLLLGFYLWLR
jgi:uncharacterized protein